MQNKKEFDNNAIINLQNLFEIEYQETSKLVKETHQMKTDLLNNVRNTKFFNHRQIIEVI